MEELIEQLEAHGYEVMVGPESILVIDNMSKEYFQAEIIPLPTFEQIHSSFSTTGGTQ